MRPSIARPGLGSLPLWIQPYVQTTSFQPGEAGAVVLSAPLDEPTGEQCAATLELQRKIGAGASA